MAQVAAPAPAAAPVAQYQQAHHRAQTLRRPRRRLRAHQQLYTNFQVRSPNL